MILGSFAGLCFLFFYSSAFETVILLDTKAILKFKQTLAGSEINPLHTCTAKQKKSLRALLTNKMLLTFISCANPLLKKKKNLSAAIMEIFFFLSFFLNRTLK